MRELNGVVLGPRPIDADCDLKGMIIGVATVGPGVKLILRGVITGDLILEAGSTAQINGVVMGTVYNRGGTVDIRGRIGGLDESDADAATAVDSAAVN